MGGLGTRAALPQSGQILGRFPMTAGRSPAGAPWSLPPTRERDAHWMLWYLVP